MKTIREINAARRNNPTQAAADAAHADLCAATATLDTPDMLNERDQAGDIRAWFAAADRAYNTRVALAREEGTLFEVPARPVTPAFWPPVEGDVWMTRHGWVWELRDGRMVAENGCEVSVEVFEGVGAVLMSRFGVRPLWEVVG